MDYRWHPSRGQTGPVDNRITDTRVPRRMSQKVEVFGQRKGKDRLTRRRATSRRPIPDIYPCKIMQIIDYAERSVIITFSFQSTAMDKQDVISLKVRILTEPNYAPHKA